MEQLIIDAEFRDLLPELTVEEFNDLEKSVIHEGIINPVIYWNTPEGKVIVDGHHRYQIAMNHRIFNIPTKEMPFKDRSDVIEWILKHQLGRRNLSDFQRNIVALRYEKIIAQKLAARMATSTGGRTPAPASHESVACEAPERIVLQEPEAAAPKTIELPRHTTTRKEIAKMAGTSERSVSQSKLILEHGSPEQIERAKKGGKGNALNTIAREVKEKATKTCAVCGMDRPLMDYHRGQDVCRICQQALIDGAADHLEQSLDNLYDIHADIEETLDDIRDDFMSNFSNSLDCLREILEDGRETILGSKAANREIQKMIREASQQVLQLGKDFVV